MAHTLAHSFIWTHTYLHVLVCRSIQWLVLGKGVISPHLSSNPNSPANAHDLSWNTGLVTHSRMSGDDWQRLLASTYCSGGGWWEKTRGILTCQFFLFFFSSCRARVRAVSGANHNIDGFILIYLVPCAWGSSFVFLVALQWLILLFWVLRCNMHIIIICGFHMIFYSIFRAVPVLCTHTCQFQCSGNRHRPFNRQ